MSKKSTIFGIACALAAIGFTLCLFGFADRFEVFLQNWGLPIEAGWHTPVGCGLLGFSFVLFVVGAFTDE